MKYYFSFNPAIDIAPVHPNLSIKLRDAQETLTIKDTGISVSDNGIESVDEIQGIARDNFSVVKAHDKILSNLESYHSKNSSNSNVNLQGN